MTITAPDQCPWLAQSNADWITLDAIPSRTGSGVVTYIVAANPLEEPRSGSVTVEDQTFTVNQDATCLYTVSPTSLEGMAGGGTGSVNVSANSSCSWTAESEVDWITITAGDTGTGDGTANYLVAANPSNMPRTGTLTIAAQKFTVIQEALVKKNIYLPLLSKS
ncbi:hypothetical protein KFU94_30935 [Chloroflexi bacterium TSY]|nr:hypothetical protein [Chloroflexi bacterium TSY]